MESRVLPSRHEAQFSLWRMTHADTVGGGGRVSQQCAELGEIGRDLAASKHEAKREVSELNGLIGEEEQDDGESGAIWLNGESSLATQAGRCPSSILASHTITRRHDGMNMCTARLCCN